MQFEPRVIRADDRAEAELALPPDLLSLAEQLTDDACHLAECYPADAARGAPATEAAQPAIVRAQPRWPARWRVAVALAIGAAGLWSASRLLPQRGPRQTPLEVTVVRIDAQTKGLPPEHRPARALAVAADSFQDLTGSEREGLLDVLEDEAIKQASLSI